MPRRGPRLDVTVSVENLDHWTRRIDGAHEVTESETVLALTAMGGHLKPLVQEKTPVDTGTLKRGIDFSVEKVRASVWRLALEVVDERARKYAWFVERGTRPHWAPMEALAGWAARKGIATFLVVRAIAKYGTIKRFGRPGPAGAEMFERTLKEERDWIEAEQKRLGIRIVKRIVR